ncbi:MAG: glutamine--scyllo-inositol aminotransferase [Gemmatales bacterium]|nr:MAG: glutamine--scyllo-inositol aminotransferase [Gemmatales bacterium]
MSSPEAQIPLCDLRIQYQNLKTEIDEAISRVLASGMFILGPDVSLLEKEIADYCGVGYGIGCSSGTDALLLALQTLEIGPGDEVIMPAFSFYATAEPVCLLGATPVFVDILPDTFNLDPDQIAGKINGRTKAIIPVHLFGQCADMEPIWRLAEKHHLAIIEDAAQAIGADYQGKRAGSLGAMGCFSFYPTKNLGAYGDGGMVVTNDPEWAQALACLRIHGATKKYYHEKLGRNARLDTLQAAILRVKLPHLETWIQARQQAAIRYDQLFNDFGLKGFLHTPVIKDQRRHVFHQYVIRVPSDLRDGLVQHLKSHQIGCEVYYPVPLHLQKCLAYLGYRAGDFPVAEAASRSVLALPMFAELTEEQQFRVVECVAEFAAANARLAA